jgi:hypothetical protein
MTKSGVSGMETFLTAAINLLETRVDQQLTETVSASTDAAIIASRELSDIQHVD